MHTSSSASIPNFYNILGVPTTATQYEIKKARDHLALSSHSDRGGNDDLMKEINRAYATLSDPIKRREYDGNQEDWDTAPTPAKIVGNLPEGRRLSKDLLDKINFWKCKGIPDTDKTIFKDLSNEDVVSPKRVPKDINPPLASYEKLLHSTIPNMSTTLSQVLPAEICNWRFTNPKVIKKEILDSPAWQQETTDILPNSTSIETDFRKLNGKVRKDSQKVHDLLNGYGYNSECPDVRGLKADLQEHLNSKSKSLFKSTSRHPAGTNIPLCPPSMIYKLGCSPNHVVNVESAALDTQAANCASCNQAYSIFLWRSNCMMCGNANCNDCLDYRFVPDFVTPVQVCKDCEPKVSESFRAEWLKPLETSYGRQQLKEPYLSLIAELGYVERDKFLELADLFIADKRFGLAILCICLGNGDLFDLAHKFIKKKSYDYARTCLSAMKNNSKEWWQQKGDFYAHSKPLLALLAYQKAELTASDYIEKALKYSDRRIGMLCVHAACNRSTYGFYQTSGLETLFGNALIQGKTLLAIYVCMLRNYSVQQWIEVINKLDIKKTDPFVQCMNAIFNVHCFSWKNLRFSADRDHLRWPYSESQTFDGWMDCLIESFDNDSYKNGIPYFRNKMKGENFVVHRDAYIAKGEYAKALICHLLIPNRISWLELAHKWHDKDETAVLACYLLGRIDLVSVGDQNFNEGKHSLALRCYLQAGKYDKIAEKIKTAKDPVRILYQLALWKYQPNQQDIILDICRTLLEKPDNVNSVRNILLYSLKDPQNANKLVYHQTLAEAGISDIDLVGLLDTVFSMCKSASEKSWLNRTLTSARTKLKGSLRIAISQGSLKDAMQLIDCINPMTLTTVRQLLAEINIDKLERGPVKSTALVVRAIACMYQIGKSRLMEAMHYTTEAMLGNPDKGDLEDFSKVLEKISQHTQNAWNLRGRAMTTLLQSKTSEFKERLKRNPTLKMLLVSEESMAKFKPFDAAMSYIDLCKAIPYAPGAVGGYLNAALELSKAMNPLWGYENINERYAYRRAIVELVTQAYIIGHSHLCPSTQLYVLRSCIAILTSAFRHFYYISDTENKLLEELYQETDRLSKVSPMALGKLVQIYDLIYLDLINNEISTLYFPMMRNLTAKSSSKGDPRYQYYLLDGAWKGWLDEKTFKFEEQRKLAMQALLKEKGNTMQEVESIMKWPGIVRDSDGWYPDKPLPLNLTDENFSRAKGIRLNMETGEIDFLLESSENPMEAVFDLDDIANVMQMGTTWSEFTLIEQDPHLPSHPFQQFLYAPGRMAQSNHLATLLHADLLLKMLTIGTEVSANVPFALRNAEEGLLQLLPENLRKQFIERYKDMAHTAGRAHRFWIQAGELIYNVSRNGNEATYTFGECSMSVKEHRLMRDHKGNLVDAPENNDKDSPEAKMADLMSKEFHTLGKIFPVFKRLGEIAKLQAMAAIAQSIYKNVQEAGKVQGPGYDRYVRFYETFRKGGIAVEPASGKVYDRCNWVPAAYKIEGSHRIYGGVSLNPKLVQGGGGFSDPWAVGGRPRYVEFMDNRGVVRGYSYSVNSFSGDMTKYLSLKGCVLDEYNQNMRKPPNIQAFWKTRTGYTDVHHFTHHTNGYHHVHFTDGWADCSNGRKGDPIIHFRSGDPRHRCGDNNS